LKTNGALPRTNRAKLIARHKTSKKMSKKNNLPNHAPAAGVATAAGPASVVAALRTAIDAVNEMTRRRTAEHLSVSRLRGVARELGELVKVMSVYGS
jgi:hypothetical protein